MCAWIVNIVLCVALCLVSVKAECEDIDSQACALMEAQEPDLCKNEALASTACPRFCDICPLECYHCNATVLDYHLCNSSQICEEDEVCMMKELKSSFDGHHEYELTCEAKEACDGMDVRFEFNTRDIHVRDVSVSCCETDMCNYPMEPVTMKAEPTTTTVTAASTTDMPTTDAPTTTVAPTITAAPPPTSPDSLTAACAVDLILVLDESNFMRMYEREVKSFLGNIVGEVGTSEDGVHVSLGTFSDNVDTRFDLNEYTTEDDVIRAINAARFDNRDHADLDIGLEYVISTAMTSESGDRPDVPNVVVIVTADGTRNDNELHALEIAINTIADVVITIELGRAVVHYENTDVSHVFHVRNERDLDDILENVTSQICA